MAQQPNQPPPLPPSQPPPSAADSTPTVSDFPQPPAPPPFDPSRSIIKRKALIKKLAAVYHAECLAYCQQLLDLQTKSHEPFVDLRKEPMKPPPKRLKKTTR